jgi:hypothetical protein
MHGRVQANAPLVRQDLDGLIHGAKVREPLQSPQSTLSTPSTRSV